MMKKCTGQIGFGDDSAGVWRRHRVDHSVSATMVVLVAALGVGWWFWAPLAVREGESSK